MPSIGQELAALYSLGNIDTTVADGSITLSKLAFDPATQAELDAVSGIVQLNGTTSVDRAFTSREVFVAAVAATPALGTLIGTEGRDVYFGSYWTAGPGVRMRYSVVSSDPTTDPTKISIGGGKWLTQAFGQTANALAFGAYCDGGTHDDLAAVQAAADWATANSTSAPRVLRFSADKYYLSAPITIGTVGGTLVQVGFEGAGSGQTKFVSTSDNSPIWQISGTIVWGLRFIGIGYTWSTAAVSTKTARVAFKLAAAGDFFNNVIRDMAFTNGHYAFDTSGMLFWGNRVSDFNLSAFTGGLYKLTGASGQPNNNFDQGYIAAQTAIGPIFQGNAIDTHYNSVEINQASLGPVVLQDTGGGQHVFDTMRLESYTCATNVTLFSVFNTRFVMTNGYFSGGTIAAGVVVTILNGGPNISGYIDVDNFAVSPASMGSGARVNIYSGGGGVQPSAQTGIVRIGHIRSTTLTWNTNLYLTDVSGSVAADMVSVTQWDNATKTEYWGDVDATITHLHPRVNLFNVALTADRTVTLPLSGSAQYSMWSGRRFEFYKPITGVGDLIIKSNTTTIAQIPGERTGHVIVTWNRGIPNGPSNAWAIIELDLTSEGYGTVGDAAATLSVGSSPFTTVWNTALTANRAVTLSTTLAKIGNRLRVVRTATGAFNLDVGGLITLTVANQWAEATFDGTAWVLTGSSTW